MSTKRIVSERELFLVLKRLRDVRAWAFKHKLDPWAFRQAMIIVLELDTVTAIEKGKTPEQLAEFDRVAREDAQKWLKNQLNA